MQAKWLLFYLVFASSRLFGQDAPKAIKYEFFSPVTGCLGFSLEQSKTNFISMDYELGFIGVKLGDYFADEAFYGGYASIGPRLYMDKDETPFNNLRGSYLKPALLVNAFYYESQDTYIAQNGLPLTDQLDGMDVTINLLLVVGAQEIIYDIASVELWLGLGYGGGWRTVNSKYRPGLEAENPSFKYSYNRIGESPLIFDIGLNLGLVY